MKKINKNKIKEKVMDAKEKVKNKSKKSNHKILIILLSLGIIFVSLALAFVIYIIVSSPEFDSDKLYSQEATILKDKNGVEFARLGSYNRDLVTYDDLPQVLVDAIVATEDSRFFQHDGFDIARFMKASFGHLGGNSGAGGASTLTMQMVKNTYTSTETKGLQGIIRKFTDIYMAIFKVEKKYTKEEIIEFYVNSQWLGTNAWGVEQACQTYFGKSVKDISLPEAALIAGIFNLPKVYNPFYSTENAENRRNVVLELMNRHGYITDEQYNDAKAISVESLIVEDKELSSNKYQSFVDAVVNEIEEDTGMNPYLVSMEIETTLDPNVQDVLEDLNANYSWVDNKVQIGIAITDTQNGSVVALNGGRNQSGERQLNRATQIHRHPGSTAKPLFDYGPLIEYNNASTGTYFFDDPMTYSNGQNVSNADRSYQGQETMRTALAASRNIPAIQAFQQLDKEKIANFVHSLGVNYGKELYESYAIGAFDGMSPLELAAAYSAFARGGYYIEPYTYTKITFKDNGDITEQKPKKEKVMSEETAYMVTSMLITAQHNNVGGNFSISGTDVAAKTGTSTYDLQALRAKGVPDSASRDNWNITYSPDYAISLWYGYDELYEKPYYTDSNRAAGVRKAIMARIAKKIYKTNSKFDKPSGVISVEVEKDSVPLQLPSDYTPADMRISELFKTGTEPSEVSIRYQKLDTPTNGNASSSGNIINLSWNSIEAKAIDQTYLQEYFTENYGQFAEKYYNKRISYNNESIGYLGYQVYLNNNGVLTPLGYTTNTTYSYDTNGIEGTYYFTIKAQYSIFKDNSSDGLEISYKIGNGSGGNTNPSSSTQIKSAQLVNDNITVTIAPGTNLNLKDTSLIKVLDNNDSDITQKLFDSNKISYTINDVNQSKLINKIDLSNSGTYEVTYSISGYSKKLVMYVTVQ